HPLLDHVSGDAPQSLDPVDQGRPALARPRAPGRLGSVARIRLRGGLRQWIKAQDKQPHQGHPHEIDIRPPGCKPFHGNLPPSTENENQSVREESKFSAEDPFAYIGSAPSRRLLNNAAERDEY